MVKKKKNQTETDRLEQERKLELNRIKDQLVNINEPTYSFQIGDHVQYGALKEAVVNEILYDGKAYGLECISTDDNYGNPYDYKTYRITPWHNIRPLEYGNTAFAKNQNIRLEYCNATIGSLLSIYYLQGIDMNPDYQREYIWEDIDREMLLDSIFSNIDIGKFVLIQLEDFSKLKNYEILDGKQRLQTLVDFYENRFPYHGKYYNDLSWKDRRAFKEHNIAYAVVDEIDKKSVLNLFLMLNQTGRAITSEHLDSVRKMMESL